MSIVGQWLAFMGFGIGIFLFGMLWVRKERREHAQSSSQLREDQAGSRRYRTSLGSREQSSSQLREDEAPLAAIGHLGAQLSELQKLTAAATESFERRQSQLEGTYAHIMDRLQSLTQAVEAASSGGARLGKSFEHLLASLQQLTGDAATSFERRETELEEAHKLFLHQLKQLADDAEASFEKRERQLVEGYAHLFHRLEELAETGSHRLPPRAP